MNDHDSANELPRLYTELADWFHLLTAPADYAEEAAFYTTTIRELVPDAHSVLELGAGGGNNASFMKADFAMTLTDLSPRMVEVSRAINPDCEHLVGDMRTLRLGRCFDAVFAHDAVMYLTREEELRQTLATAFAHCRPGGACVVVPDHVRETFRESSHCGGHGAGDRGLRYLSWSWDPDPDDSEYRVDFVYLLREAGRPPRVEHEWHRFGVFPRATWLRAFTDAGFGDVRSSPAPYGANDGPIPEVFVGVR